MTYIFKGKSNTLYESTKLGLSPVYHNSQNWRSNMKSLYILHLLEHIFLDLFKCKNEESISLSVSYNFGTPCTTLAHLYLSWHLLKMAIIKLSANTSPVLLNSLWGSISNLCCVIFPYAIAFSKKWLEEDICIAVFSGQFCGCVWQVYSPNNQEMLNITQHDKDTNLLDYLAYN